MNFTLIANSDDTQPTRSPAAAGVQLAQDKTTGAERKLLRFDVNTTDWLDSLYGLGRISAETKNKSARLVSVGRFGPMARAAGEVGLPLEQSHITFYPQRGGNAVCEYSERTAQRCVRFYDRGETPVHEITLTADGNVSAYQHLLENCSTVADGMLSTCAGPDEHCSRHCLRRTTACSVASGHISLSRVQQLKVLGKDRSYEVEPASLYSFIEALIDAALPCTLDIENSTIAHRYSGLFHSGENTGTLKLVGSKCTAFLALPATLWIVNTQNDLTSTPKVELCDPTGNRYARLSLTAAQCQSSTVWERIVSALC